MRRFTMTPNSRNPTKAPMSTPRAAPFPRHSIMAEETKRRDIRPVRDKAHVQHCADNVQKFLTENGYDGALSPTTLFNPTSKDFHFIFRFIYAFIEDFEYTGRFEDDVISILRNLRYPYSGEVTKSQLSVITPHAWPVVLSMLSWMVDLISQVLRCLEEEREESVETYFFDYVCEGYMRFMEGDEDDAALEEAFEKRVTDLYTDMFDEIDQKKEELSDIESRIAEVTKTFGEKLSLDQRKKELADDLNMLIVTEKQLEGKKIKYATAIEKLGEEMLREEEEAEVLRRQQLDLRDQITKQKINPSDLKEMNAEKMELFKELERIKPEKEKLARIVNELEAKLQERIEELEKYFFDLKNLREDLSLKLVRNELSLEIVNDYKCSQTLERGMSEVIDVLEDELNTRREAIVIAEINRNMLEEACSEKENAYNELSNKLRYLNDKLMTTGKLYLEKKEISENEQRKSKAEMEMLENELLKLNLESNTSLLMSEQTLQKAKIMLDRTLNSTSCEREEINKMVFNFYNTVADLHEALQAQVGELKALLDQ
jgi:kinetochore protein NDC80